MCSVLYISSDGLTDPLGGSQIIPYLENLSKKHTIHILACEKQTAFLKNSRQIKDILDKSGLEWHVVKFRNKPPVFGSWLMQRDIKRKAKIIVRKNNIKLIHCRSYPASIVGLSLSKKFGIPFIFDMRGFWADERIDRHIWNKQNPFYYFLYCYFKFIEKRLISKSKRIITLTNKAKDILVNDFAANENKITVMPCATDIKFFQKKEVIDEGKYRRMLGLNTNDKLLLYMGSVGSCYLVDEMLRFFKYGKTLIPDLKMAFFTLDENHSQILAMAEKLRISTNQIICRFIPRRELPGYLSVVDYSVMFFEQSFSIQASSPTKHGELLSRYIPVVVNAGVGDLEKIVVERNTGCVVKSFSDAEFDKAWRHLITSQFKPESFDETIMKYYSLEKATEKLEKLYKLSG